MEDRLLHYIPLFDGLPEEQMRKLAANGIYQNYRPGEIIAGEEETIRAIHLVVWGRVRIYRMQSDGHEQTMYIFGPGEPFCLTLLADPTFPATAVAIEETRVLSLPASMLEDMGRKEPSLVFNILLVLIRRLKEAMHVIELLSLKEVPQRVAAYFLHMHAMQGGSDIVELEISQRELAKILGTTPETLSRVLKKMSTQGLLRVNGRTFKLLELQKLEKIAYPPE